MIQVLARDILLLGLLILLPGCSSPRTCEIPFKGYPRSVIVPVTIDAQSHPVNFLVDTGATTTLVSDTILKPKGWGNLSGTAYGIGGSQPVTMIKLRSLTIGTFRINHPTVQVGKFTEVFGRTRVVGLLGQDILRDFLVTFDNENQKLILRERSARH